MAIAFPLGFMLGGRNTSSEVLPRQSSQTATRREIFSPKILSDPYFLEQQRRNVEALEDVCRRTGQSCREAREARHWLEKLPIKE
ncbi:hypothetical protein [Altererythrobacter sp. Root672]|uniref:hypothetical protein n=1 Tax=Altererythrobacter sp. Root672 TaxID=1736584 RepID=UPI0012E3CA97|nr:hypothetical protein [Altererythrobacter sp. Root672]